MTPRGKEDGVREGEEERRGLIDWRGRKRIVLLPSCGLGLGFEGIPAWASNTRRCKYMLKYNIIIVTTFSTFSTSSISTPTSPPHLPPRASPRLRTYPSHREYHTKKKSHHSSGQSGYMVVIKINNRILKKKQAKKRGEEGEEGKEGERRGGRENKTTREYEITRIWENERQGRNDEDKRKRKHREDTKEILSV